VEMFQAVLCEVFGGGFCVLHLSLW
jgi:hypothetical protein